MKEKQNKGIILICIVAIILIVVILLMQGGKKDKPKGEEQQSTIKNEIIEENVEKKEDGSEENISKQLKSEKEIEGIKITNIKLVKNGNTTQLIADATNTTNEKIDEQNIIITAIDKNGNSIGEFEASIYMLEAGKTTKLNAGITKDIVNAYDFTVRKK